MNSATARAAFLDKLKLNIVKATADRRRTEGAEHGGQPSTHSDFHSGIVGVGGILQREFRIVLKDGRILEVMEVVGVKGSRVSVERFRPLQDTVLKTVSCSVHSSGV